MKKTNEQLIADFKKSNKERREKIAKAAGFSTGDAYLASLSGSKKPAKISPTKKTSKKKDVLDYVVAFDTTGSMAAYINDVKKHVEKLIPEMFSKDMDLKMKIIAFGDYCDMTNKANFGKAYQESQFTNDENHLQNFVRTAQNTGGGDSDEFYELVIKKIVEETPWREGAKKTVLLIADCEPHKIGYSYSNYVENNQIDWKEEAKKAAEKGISFDTLSILGMPWYKELSSITNGVNMPFKSAEKMSEVVAASAYARGTSMKSRATFTAAYASAVNSGDTELIGTYKTLSTLLDK